VGIKKPAEFFATGSQLWITREKVWKSHLNWGKLVHFTNKLAFFHPPYMGGVPRLPPYIEIKVIRCLESKNLSNLFPTLAGENFLFSLP
jgi:hypothetical protein